MLVRMGLIQFPHLRQALNSAYLVQIQWHIAERCAESLCPAHRQAIDRQEMRWSQKNDPPDGIAVGQQRSVSRGRGSAGVSVSGVGYDEGFRRWAFLPRRIL